jgi:hypothetical protein
MGVQGLWHNIGAQGGSTNEYWMQYGVAQYNHHSKQIGYYDRFYENEGLNTRIYVYSKENYVPYKPVNYLPPMYFEQSVLSPIVQPLNDIRSYRSQMWARFVAGDLALNDTNWNNYVSTLNNMGTRNVIDAYQKNYDTFLRNSRR